MIVFYSPARLGWQETQAHPRLGSCLLRGIKVTGRALTLCGLSPPDVGTTLLQQPCLAERLGGNRTVHTEEMVGLCPPRARGRPRAQSKVWSKPKKLCSGSRSACLWLGVPRQVSFCLWAPNLSLGILEASLSMLVIPSRCDCGPLSFR